MDWIASLALALAATTTTAFAAVFVFLSFSFSLAFAAGIALIVVKNVVGVVVVFLGLFHRSLALATHSLLFGFLALAFSFRR